MERRGHIYLPRDPQELDGELVARRRRLRRVQGFEYVALEDVQLRQVDYRSFEFTTRIQMGGQHGQVYGYASDAQLVELHDMIARYLELQAQPVVVNVALEQPKRRSKRRPAPAPAPAAEQLDEVGLIKRRMLEGR